MEDGDRTLNAVTSHGLALAQRVFASVPEAVLAEASRVLRERAMRDDYGRLSTPGPPALDLPHELEAALWDSECDVRSKIEAFWIVYDVLPSYGWTMYVHFHYPTWSSVEREEYWARARERLATREPALVHPLEYAVWCDWFEDRETVQEAWVALTGEGAVAAVVESALRVSGPVPYDLKRRLYERLVADPRWHPFIFRSILGSAFDVYGQVDPSDALAWLRRLTFAAQPAEWDRLVGRLQGAA